MFHADCSVCVCVCVCVGVRDSLSLSLSMYVCSLSMCMCACVGDHYPQPKPNLNPNLTPIPNTTVEFVDVHLMAKPPVEHPPPQSRASTASTAAEAENVNVFCCL